jgi:hypothetical protein
MRTTLFNFVCFIFYPRAPAPSVRTYPCCHMSAVCELHARTYYLYKPIHICTPYGPGRSRSRRSRRERRRGNGQEPRSGGPRLGRYAAGVSAACRIGACVTTPCLRTNLAHSTLIQVALDTRRASKHGDEAPKTPSSQPPLSLPTWAWIEHSEARSVGQGQSIKGHPILEQAGAGHPACFMR